MHLSAVITVACVLRSGGIYDAGWVEILRAAVSRNMSYQYRFVCLRDMIADVSAIGAEPIELDHDWPGWWSKIELFRPNLFWGPVLYLDLDVVITGPLDGLVRRRDGLTMCRDFYLADSHNSSVMAWQGDLSHIHAAFARNPDAAMTDYTRRRDGRIGDQAFIEDHAPKVDRFPDGEVVSYKKHARHGPPAGAKVVSFHGKPKPSDAAPSVDWVRKHWRT